MGFISRKLFPACESMCVCCPALRSRSRQPVKRYKKLLAEIFPKSTDGSSSDRKIVKLCEYAAKNPFRIPKIAKYLEERCYKELRSEHIKFIKIIGETYNKLLCMCKEQIACFAVNLLNVVVELLEDSKRDAVQIIGCQTLTTFIYSQVDGTYTHNIENFVPTICKLAREAGEEHQKRCLRASSLQCLSAMVWFMTQVSHIFADIEEIVHAILDNYEHDVHNGEDLMRGQSHPNWVDEVVRCEGKAVGELTPIMRPRPAKKDPSMLTREEIDTPKVWAQICIQRIVELAKESTTLRRALEPMLVYFDTRRHWTPRHGLATIVLSDMCYFSDSSGKEQLILAGVIRHLDHKNVAHDPQFKSHVIQTASALGWQIRAGAALSDIGIVSDLCRHLRKSLQATSESYGEQDLSINLTLQASIEECLLEIAKGIVDIRPLFDMMAMTLEKLPCGGVVARATLGSLIILAHMASLASASSHIQQVFPEALLDQLVKVMLHSDVEIRVGGHHIYSVLLMPSTNHPKRWHSSGTSTFASVSALLQKLRKEQNGSKLKQGISVQDDSRDRKNVDEEWRQGWAGKNSPNFHKLSSMIDITAENESSVLKLNEDQISQLLSAFWVQALVPDNLPANFEAIAHSFCLTLISSRLRNPKDNLIVRFFQLPLSIMNISFDSNYVSLPPAYQRSLLVLSISMLMFMAKIYHIAELNTLLKSLLEYDVDPYLGIGDDFQVHVKPQVDVREYGSPTDNQAAVSLLFELEQKIHNSHRIILDILVENLCSITGLVADDLVQQLSEGFTPDESFFFSQQSIIDMDHVQMGAHCQESPPSDGDEPRRSMAEDTLSESSVIDVTRFIPKMPVSPSPSMSHIVSVVQLLESALEVAGQVAGTSVSTSPLPYTMMAGQCEALGTDMRKKLSNWLNDTHSSNSSEILLPASRTDVLSAMRKINNEDVPVHGALPSKEPWLSLRLPPASPFDNFLRAARG